MGTESGNSKASAPLAQDRDAASLHTVLQALENRTPVTRDLSGDLGGSIGLGPRMADAVARIGGSWGFVGGFFVFLLTWSALNLFGLPRAERFDPYPFIFLNLLLSMLAAIQAPIIMMSQNRQSEKDRIESRHDYEVNLKAELEILTLHEKLDRLHQDHLAQLGALRALLEERLPQQSYARETGIGGEKE